MTLGVPIVGTPDATAIFTVGSVAFVSSTTETALFDSVGVCALVRMSFISVWAVATAEDIAFQSSALRTWPFYLVLAVYALFIIIVYLILFLR